MVYFLFRRLQALSVRRDYAFAAQDAAKKAQLSGPILRIICAVLGIKVNAVGADHELGRA
ncbi:hypothetical protein BV911_15190 [Pseudoruegeria sp. SK021]|nr:hypothetical protein BV911_15190 [Pseudoruegeria sp. SK021]